MVCKALVFIKHPLSKNAVFALNFAKTPYICRMERKILPTGRQNFRKLREDNCIYVDKTQHIYNLCRDANAYSISRPRRFGKSLLLSTMNDLFSGSKALFEDTWIYDKWNWTQTNPVIYISFLNIPYEDVGLTEGLTYHLLELYEEFKLEPPKIRNLKMLFFEFLNIILSCDIRKFFHFDNLLRCF